MTTAIYKYELSMTPGLERLTMPGSPFMLSVQVQNGKPVLYAAVRLDFPSLSPVTVRAMLTGEPHSDDLGFYLGSAVLHDGDYVLHYFDVAV